MTSSLFTFARPFAGLLRATLAVACLAVAGCGGHGSEAPPADAPLAGTAPTITEQPANRSITAGQPAAFAVTAVGDAPLAYQWQRNGADVAGATSTSYALAAAAVADSGATFRVVVSNGAGSVTSNAATLTVTASAPVLTVTQQPASTSVVAGAAATFTVAATCSSGTLAVQWQRSAAGGTFADAAGATNAAYSLSTSVGDNGAMFRAALSCGGQSTTTSQAATLTVTSPGGVGLAYVVATGRQSQADLSAVSGVLQEPAGSYLLTYAFGVKRLSADLSSVTPVAGGASAGAADGPAVSATFDFPRGLARDAAGNLYVADSKNHTIRRIATDGTVSTLAGTAGSAGTVDGTGSAARFNFPVGIALGPDGDLYITDNQNHRIRRVTTSGVVTTYAGSTSGLQNGAAATARFFTPNGIAVAANGDVLVADQGNSLVRRILRSGNGAGNVETLAGGSGSNADGIGTSAGIPSPSGLFLRGNALGVVDGTGLLRRIDLATQAVTTVTGSRTLGAGLNDGSKTTARLSPDGGGVTGLGSDGFLLADFYRLRTVSAAGDVRTIASNFAFGVSATGTGVLAQMPLALGIPTSIHQGPIGLAGDAAGNIVLAEQNVNLVRRISAAGDVAFIAGLVDVGGSVDGVGSEATFGVPLAVANAAAGVLYVADGSAVRRVGSDHAVTTIAGAYATHGAIDGNGTAARFEPIYGLTVAANGDVFVADQNNHAVRRIDAAGNVTTYAGALGQAGTADGPVAAARLAYPSSVAFAPDGSLLVAADGNLRRVAADGTAVTTVYTSTGDDTVGRIAVAADGTVYWGGSSHAHAGRGLWMLAPGSTTPTLVVPAQGVQPVVGTGGSARVGEEIYDLAFIGTKQLAVLTGDQLVRVTLP